MTWRSAAALAVTGLLAGAALVLLAGSWSACWRIHPALAIALVTVIALVTALGRALTRHRASGARRPPPTGGGSGW